MKSHLRLTILFCLAVLCGPLLEGVTAPAGLRCDECTPRARTRLITLQAYDAKPDYIAFVGVLQRQVGAWFTTIYSGKVVLASQGHLRLYAQLKILYTAAICPDDSIVVLSDDLIRYWPSGYSRRYKITASAYEPNYSHLACDRLNGIWFRTETQVFRYTSHPTPDLTEPAQAHNPFLYGPCRSASHCAWRNFANSQPFPASNIYPTRWDAGDGSYWTTDFYGVTHIQKNGKQTYIRFFPKLMAFHPMPFRLIVNIAPDGAAWVFPWSEPCRISILDQVACDTGTGQIGAVSFAPDGTFWYVSPATTLVHASLPPISFPEK